MSRASSMASRTAVVPEPGTHSASIAASPPDAGHAPVRAGLEKAPALPGGHFGGFGE